MTFLEFFSQYGPIFAALTAIATVLGVAFGFYKASHSRHVSHLRDRIAQLEKNLEKFKGEDPESVKLLNEQLRQQLDEARKGMAALNGTVTTLQNNLKARKQELEAERDRAQQVHEELTRDLEKAQEELAGWNQEDRSRANRVKKVLKLEGRVWERKVLRGIPGFRPLHERHVPIISVLNLKGGVGKTTATAHLGAALAARGYRVLLVDLDLQGSLSSMFINPSILTERSAANLLLQHFLTSAASRRKVNLLEYQVPILGGRSGIVATADTMAYAELNLTMQWLLRIGRKDTRFLLRRALHQKRVSNRYDIVLLDCPPFFNTCCVNALAASDYILIPVLPSQKAAERVPFLLQRLKRLCGVINPDLQIIGVLLNRTRGHQLTAWEEDLWRDLQERSKDQWKLPVHAFQTFIRQTNEVRDNENEFSPPVPGSELHTLFTQLVADLEARLPRDCCRTATTPL
jgi:chromosome partitioning protein